jgi:DNA-binding transcriptional ArsR family regulator
MAREFLSDDVIAQVADRFRALSEPARLQLLRALARGEHTVNELVEQTGLGQANVSKHLQVLHAHGFVRRRRNGLFVHYAIADRQVVRLCHTMSSRVTPSGGRGASSNGASP